MVQTIEAVSSNRKPDIENAVIVSAPQQVAQSEYIFDPQEAAEGTSPVMAGIGSAL